jgi:hypothetical protein
VSEVTAAAPAQISLLADGNKKISLEAAGDVSTVSSLSQNGNLESAQASTGAPAILNSVINAQSCTPNDNPQIHNGLCFTMRQLSVQCVDKKASVSKDCAFGRFCCFEDNGSVGGSTDIQNQANNVVVTSGQDQSQSESSSTQNPGQSAGSQDQGNAVVSSSDAQNQGQSNLQVAPANPNPVTVVVASVQMPVRSCSPNSNPLIKNGHCLTIRELRASCVDQKASPSSDCDMGSWCCFTDDSDKITTEAPLVAVAVALPAVPEVQQPSTVQTETPATVPVTQPVTVPETTAAPTELPVAIAPAATSNDQQCSPNSRPEISDGTCMPTRDLRVRCKNQRVSKSPQCKIGHWCCFTDAQNPVPPAVNELSRSINAL